MKKRLTQKRIEQFESLLGLCHGSFFSGEPWITRVSDDTWKAQQSVYDGDVIYIHINALDVLEVHGLPK